jgi:integrase
MRLRRREFIAGLGGAAAWPLAARAQQGDRVRRIGVLIGSDENDPVNKTYVSAFTQALAELGCTDGRNVRMDLRWGGGDINRIRGCAGLGVIVYPTGRKTFVVRYRLHGVPDKYTFEPDTTLAEARKEAPEIRREARTGRDPKLARQEAKEKAAAAAADTLQAICEEYFRREGAGLRTAETQRSTLARLVYKPLGARPIGSIRRKGIIRLLDKIADENGPRMADLVLAHLRRVMNWHAVRDDDFRSPIVRGMSRVKTKERARTRTLSDDELRRIWTATETPGPFEALIRFLLLTGARRSEAAELPWSEIDGADWCLPAPRNKTKVDLVRPLSAAALAVIAAQPRISPYVFAKHDGRPLRGFSAHKETLDEASGVTGWRLHDLRRTARSLLSRAAVPADHSEQCLGHVLPGIRQTYDRHKYHSEKMRAYEALAALIERIINPTDNVIALRGQ